MDHQRDSRQRSPHRDHQSREWSDGRSRNRGNRQRDSRSRSPEHKRVKTKSSRNEVSPRERDARHSSSRLHRSSHRHRERASQASESQVNPHLPFSARPLSKADLPTFEPLFARYLDLQKQKDIDELDDREVKGRWKSFVGKWNRGELAEGWYDPEVFARAKEAAQGRPRAKQEMIKADGFDAKDYDPERERDGSDEDDYGPVLPGSNSTRRAGPGIPTLQDLSLRAEMDEEDKQVAITDLRTARKADRAIQKERLDDLVPRAEPGTRERQLEKKQLLNEKMRSFREKSPGMEAGDEREIMGGGDSLEEFKRTKEREQKRKTEREIRREEIERAKQEEMEEKRRVWREREEGTVSMLKELARQRFG